MAAPGACGEAEEDGRPDEDARQVAAFQRVPSVVVRKCEHCGRNADHAGRSRDGHAARPWKDHSQ